MERGKLKRHDAEISETTTEDAKVSSIGPTCNWLDPCDRAKVLSVLGNLFHTHLSYYV